MSAYGYKEAVTDEQLVSLVESGVQNSTGDWLNSSDLARERLKATYEYAGLPVAHLSPQGVSTTLRLVATVGEKAASLTDALSYDRPDASEKWMSP